MDGCNFQTSSNKITGAKNGFDICSASSFRIGSEQIGGRTVESSSGIRAPQVTDRRLPIARQARLSLYKYRSIALRANLFSDVTRPVRLDSELAPVSQWKLSQHSPV